VQPDAQVRRTAGQAEGPGEEERKKAMKFQKARELTTNATVYCLRIEDTDLLLAPLDQFDMMLLRECGDSTSIADQLLALETIARRIEQQQGTPQP
jgi:hypothetical protein